MIKRTLFIVPIVTLLYLAPGTVRADEAASAAICIVSEAGNAGGQVENTGGQASAALAGAVQTETDGKGTAQTEADVTGGSQSGTGLADASQTENGQAIGQEGSDAGANDQPESEKEKPTGPASDFIVKVEKIGPGIEIARKAAQEAGQAEGESAGASEGVTQTEAGEAQEENGDGSLENEVQVQKLSYSEEDLYVLAHVLAGECQSCPDEEQLYVGSVVLNRKNHPSFPKSIKGVVFQKGQYACTWDGNYYRTPTERNWSNARKLLEEGSILPGNVIWQSGARQGKGVYLKTRWHYYCY